MKAIPLPPCAAGIKVNETLPPAGRAGKGALFRCYAANRKTFAPVGRADWGQQITSRRVAAPATLIRRGTASVVAIAVLVVLAGIIAQQVRRVLMERRQMRNEVAYLQAEKLADAGLLFAQKSRSSDPAWTGLTWNLPPGSIHQTNSAEVVLSVQDHLCTAVARYPLNAEIPFQVTRTRKLAP